VAQCIGGHVRCHGIRWILNHRETALGTYGTQARAAIIEQPSQDDTNDATTVRLRCRTEQRIDCRARPILARAAGEPRGPALHEEVMIRRRHVDPARADGAALRRMNRRQWAGSTQKLWKLARTPADMLHHEQSRRDVACQPGRKFLQRVHPAHRGTDHDDRESIQMRTRELTRQPRIVATRSHAEGAGEPCLACLNPLSKPGVFVWTLFSSTRTVPQFRVSL
jgi:hypothetical protein